MTIADWIKELADEENAKILRAMNNYEYPSSPIDPDKTLRQIAETERLNSLTLDSFEGDYTAAIKMRLSGLSERSHGNGMDKRTVIHAIAIKPISRSRFTRLPRQFVCGAKSAREYGVGERVGCTVTCEKCNDLIQRHNLKPCNDKDLGRFIDSY
jgi:hypothetical protein